MSETEEKGHVKREPGSWREGEEDWRCLRAVPFQETRETRTTSSTTSSTTWVHAVTTIPGSCPGRSVIEHTQRGNLDSDLDIALHARQLKNRPLGVFLETSWTAAPPSMRGESRPFFLLGLSLGGCLESFSSWPGSLVWTGRNVTSCRFHNTPSPSGEEVGRLVQGR